MQRNKIVYILSYPRSGSTLVGSVLADACSVAHVGETFFIWKNVSAGSFPDRGCGCGQRMASCSFWSPLMQDSFKRHAQNEGRTIDNQQLFQLRAKSFSKFGYKRDAAPEYGRFMGLLYQQIFSATNKPVIVDSSKELSFAKFVNTLKGYDVFYVYLTRDPRGVVLSRQRKLKKNTNGKTSLNYLYLIYDLVMINIGDILTRRFLRGKDYIYLRYEDFVQDPESSIATICDRAGLNYHGDIFIDTKTVNLKPNHIAVGNKIKYQIGRTLIREDMRWKHDLGDVDKKVINALTGIFRSKHKY